MYHVPATLSPLFATTWWFCRILVAWSELQVPQKTPFTLPSNLHGWKRPLFTASAKYWFLSPTPLNVWVRLWMECFEPIIHRKKTQKALLFDCIEWDLKAIHQENLRIQLDPGWIRPAVHISPTSCTRSGSPDAPKKTPLQVWKLTPQWPQTEQGSLCSKLPSPRGEKRSLG